MSCRFSVAWLRALTLVVVVVGSSAADPTWHGLLNAPVAESSRFNDVWFIDENVGWTGYSGRVYRTVDGGATWQSFSVPMRGIRCIAFANAANGWVGSVVDSLALWSTTDSGATWHSIDLPAPKPRGLCGLSIVGSAIYGCGAWYGSPTVVKSLDAGASWTSIDLSAIATGLVDCHFFSPDSGFVVGRVGPGWLTNWRELVLFTPDGGETWETRHTGTFQNSWCWKISFPTRRFGFVSVESYEPTPTRCLKTEDGGLTWTEVQLPASSAGMQGIGFATPSMGWVGGMGPTMWTSDRGSTWVNAGWGDDINRIRFLGPNIGYAAGRTIHKYSEPSAVLPVEFTDVKRKYR